MVSKMKFKSGDLLVLKHAERMGAVVGALGVCRGYSRGGTTSYVQIQWIRNTLSGRQGDGGYYERDFDFYDKADGMKALDLSYVKQYPIVKFLEGLK